MNSMTQGPDSSLLFIINENIYPVPFAVYLVPFLFPNSYELFLRHAPCPLRYAAFLDSTNSSNPMNSMTQ